MAESTQKSSASGSTAPGSSVFSYLKSRYFLRTVGGIVAASLILFFAANWLLSWYTNHGQRLEVGDYIEMSIDDAAAQIERADFRVKVIDSVFLLDKPPGVVLRQDPAPGAFVKENRRIYLTITKKIPDEVRLPALTGTYDFDRYRRKLNMLDISGSIKDRVYSSRYQPNTILKVYFEGREITEAQLKEGYRVPKGSELEFQVTSKEGGLADVPNLRCRTFEEAKFFIENYRLRVGRVDVDASVTNPDLGYVWRQDPPYREGARIPFEAEVHLFITARAPEDCESL